MNWDAISAIGEMIGAAAVFVSIIYLSIQIRANTRATQGSASYDAAHSWAQTNEQMYQLPDETLADLGRWMQGDAPEAFSGVARGRCEICFRSIYQKLEGQYFLYKYGLLDADLWEARRAIARGMIQTANARAWWERETQAGALSAQFIQAIEGAES